MAKVYLFRGILLLLFGIFTKVFEHKLFSGWYVNEEVYSEEYHLLDYCISRLSSLLLSGRPVQSKQYIFKEKGVFTMY